MITLIHVAKKELALNEDNYRALLQGVTGKDSLRDMKLKELEAVIQRFKDFGFKKKKSKPKRAGKRKSANSEHARLIRALWLSLYHLGEVRDPSEEAMSAYVKRMSKVDDLKWLDEKQSQKVLGGLRDWMRRAGYIRPTEKDYKYFSCININNSANLNNGSASINAAHVLMAQAKIAFKSLSEFNDFLINEGVEKLDHPYTLPLEEMYLLTEKLGTKIRKNKGARRG